MRKHSIGLFYAICRRNYPSIFSQCLCANPAPSPKQQRHEQLASLMCRVSDGYGAPSSYDPIAFQRSASDSSDSTFIYTLPHVRNGWCSTVSGTKREVLGCRHSCFAFSREIETIAQRDLDSGLNEALLGQSRRHTGSSKLNHVSLTVIVRRISVPWVWLNPAQIKGPQCLAHAVSNLSPAYGGQKWWSLSSSRTGTRFSCCGYALDPS